ncbi:MAG: prephenate dehydrogenase [Clostridia bacterium]|nr:prephenate dehydrogenase [Clostridia bacterium]
MQDNTLKSSKISIIGLGLIGGSLAKALRERAGISRITAVTRQMDSIKHAIQDGTISCGYTEITQEVLDSDIIFICTPVRRTIKYIDEIAGKVKPDCIITDVGSTKAEIVEYVNNMENPPCFIGGHPMAGSEKTGYSASFSHLFENAYYILSPSKSTHGNHLQLMTDLIKIMGGIPVILDSKEHDRITASISHVPHVIASALVNLVKATDTSDGKMQMLAAGGFKDITRIASSSPEMWENIVSSNSQQVCTILDSFKAMLDEFKKNLIKEDNKNIFDFFKSAKDFRDLFVTSGNVLNPVKGLITPIHEIIVDVIDKPGIIGEIATILGNNGINIKNINVSNSREFEQGCLRITLPDSESTNIAFDLLCSKGYKVYKSN